MSFNCARAHACSTIRVRENPSGDWWKRARGREGKKARASWLLINTQLVATVRYPCDARFRSTCLNVQASCGRCWAQKKKIQKYNESCDAEKMQTPWTQVACFFNGLGTIQPAVVMWPSLMSLSCPVYFMATQGNQINRTGRGSS